jgi:site-specific recombinase XerD
VLAASSTDAVRPAPNSIIRLLPSWTISLQAQNKSPRTIGGYTESMRQFLAFLVESGMPTTVDGVRREHVESYIAHVLDRHKPSTAATRYKGLRIFFEWAREEGDITESPMRNMKPPAIPETMPNVLTDDEMRRVLKVCAGSTFANRRDLAIVWMLMDTGMRRAELAGLTVADIDWEIRVARVLGKGRRPRNCAFGKNTAQALDRYVRRARDLHAYAHLDALWLSTKGALSADGVRQMLERRGEQAGVARLHAHQFRHYFTHTYLAGGGREGDLMMLNGWRSPQMVRRYAAATAAAPSTPTATSRPGTGSERSAPPRTSGVLTLCLVPRQLGGGRAHVAQLMP